MTFSQKTLMCAALAVALGGCSTPAYRMPVGFSSSDHRGPRGAEPTVMTATPPSAVAPSESRNSPSPAAVQPAGYTARADAPSRR